MHYKKHDNIKRDENMQPLVSLCIICHMEKEKYAIAEYIFNGNSLCEEHFNQKINETILVNCVKCKK